MVVGPAGPLLGAGRRAVGVENGALKPGSSPRARWTLSVSRRCSSVTSETTVPVRPAASGPPGTVDVIGVVGRRVEVHHAGQVVDMNAPGHHIGGHQRIGPALGEGVEGPLALTLGAVPVHRDGAHTLGLELADHPVRTSLGPAEHERLPVFGHDLGRDGHPLRPVDLPEVVDDVAFLVVVGFDVDPYGIVLVAANDGLDLAVRWSPRTASPGVGGRSGPTGGARPAGSPCRTCGQPRRARPWSRRRAARPRADEVLEPPGTGHHHVDPLVQGAALVAIAGPAEDRHHPPSLVTEQ